MKHLLTVLFIFSSLFSHGQNPLVKMWDKRFGGTEDEILYSIYQTADGGYILGGSSYSGISGDKTQPIWGGLETDFWIVKTDSLGNKQWDKDFGGTGSEGVHSVHQTSDGGYILGGYSNSGISGDKTQASWGSGEYWIVKTDSLGNKEWDKDFGGTDYEMLCSVQQTSDGGYILGGESDSGISGDKTQATWGNLDYWIIKTDALGNKQWDRDFGGTYGDQLFSIRQTADGGYILGGISGSGISGDKTQATQGGIGDADYWIVKTDSLGNKQWDKDFGGTSYEEILEIISQTSDNGFLIAGSSTSSMGGNKTENNLGSKQTWVVKTDSLGNKQWDKTMFTSGQDGWGLAIQTRDECYAIANWSNGVIAGYKTQPAWNNTWDYWLIKFCDSTFIQANLTTTNNLCPGSCTDFTNLSFNASSYQWNFFGASPDTSTAINPTNICYPNPGSYNVQLIATNANGSDTLLLTNYITVYPSPLPQSITQSGDTLFAIAGASSFQWYFNTNIISGATNYFYVAPSSGDYNVVATDANGCEVEAAVFDVVAGMQLTVDHGLMTIFPNPVGDKLIIHKAQVTSETAIETSVFNVLGEKISLAVDSRLLTVDCRLLSPGIYYIEITSCGKTFRSKFVKQ